MEKIKVLMADDEKDVLEIMAKKVANEGYDVVTAYDGQDAWEKIQSQSPDVVILDLTMPRMNGFTVLKNVREQSSPGKWQPVIIVSALGELEDVQKGMAEADHYLVKPCPVGDIVKAIELMVALIPLRRGAGEEELA